LTPPPRGYTLDLGAQKLLTWRYPHPKDLRFFCAPRSTVGRGREYPNSARRPSAVLNLPAALLPRVFRVTWS
jgi:hypothetical protein